MWDGEAITLTSIKEAKSNPVGWKVSRAKCKAGCPKTVTNWGEKLYLNGVLDRCPRVEGAAKCRSYKRATAC